MNQISEDFQSLLATDREAREERYDYDKLERNVARVYAALREFMWEFLDQPCYRAVCAVLVRELKLPLSAVASNLIYYKDKELSAELLEQIVRRFVGNTLRIKELELVPVWEPDAQISEWSLIKVLDAEMGKFNYEGLPAFNITFRFHTGFVAGRSFTKLYRTAMAAKLANLLGLAWKHAEQLYPEELYGMLGYCLVNPPWRDNKVPGFSRLYVTAKQKKHNFRLYRGRVDSKACPYGYKPHQYRSCRDCHVGQVPMATDDQDAQQKCEWACRRKTSAPIDQHAADAPTGGTPLVQPGPGHHDLHADGHQVSA